MQARTLFWHRRSHDPKFGTGGNVMKLKTNLVILYALSLFLAGMMAVPYAESVEAASSSAAKAVLEFDKSGTKPTKKYRIAYVTECVQNPYCQARLQGLKDAAAKYGFDFKIFLTIFSPSDSDLALSLIIKGSR